MPAFPDNLAPRPRLGGATEAILAISRLVSAGAGGPAPAVSRVRDALVAEARGLLGAPHALLLAVEQGEARAVAVAGDAEGRFALEEDSALRELLDRGLRVLALDGSRAAELLEQLSPWAAAAGSALLVAVPPTAADHVLVLAHPDPAAFGPEATAVAEALAAAGAAALARDADAQAAARRAERQAALTRAASALHESLDLDTVLGRICLEATRILDGDYTVVYRGTTQGIVLEAAYGLPSEMIGFRLEPGQGLSGKVLDSQQSMLTNDYQSIAGLPPDTVFSRIQSCIAVPMRWGGELRGVLSVGYSRPCEATEERLGLLETFAELASVACTNATAHAGLALAARTDGLTGCLNHAALHESLRREIERAERAIAPALSLVMLDLDDFKSVNELHGHLVGDEVLRRAGHALRQATRPYDVAARYGGDEFALVAVEAGEEEAEEIARRAIERITTAIGDLCEGAAGRATAGVAEWEAGVTPTELVARADRALLFGKHDTGRGDAVVYSSLPDWFRPARFSRPDRATPAPPLGPGRQGGVEGAAAWRGAARPTEERLRERARRLARANAVGARLAVMEEPAEILAVAAGELEDLLDAESCTLLALRPDGSLERVAGTPLEDLGLAGRAVRERRSVLAAEASARARIAVPVRVAGAQWGAVQVKATRPGAFDEDDVGLVEAVAEHVGAALQSALRLADARAARAGDRG